MGTSTKFTIGDKILTPEECSAEILQELFKNLPDEIRENKGEVGTVITVPAAFNQMQNAATLDAAKMAGLGKVALMQEPVAAIMRVMKDNQSDGKFLVFESDGELGLSLRYESRTPDKKVRVAVVLANERDGYTFEISSLDSGWSSGLIPLKNKSLVTVSLHKRGENKFVVEVFDRGGDSVFQENDTIIITQTFANVGALLAAHSIGVEVKDRIGSNISRLEYLVREGDRFESGSAKSFTGIFIRVKRLVTVKENF